MELIVDLTPWHWLVLALALFALEVFASSEFFIGIAFAAFAIAALLAFFPDMSWELQLGLFGLLSVLFTLLYYKFFRRFNEETDAPLLNDRAGQLVGESFLLQSDINQKGAVMLHDTRWHVRCDGTLSEGTMVTIVATEGMTLVLEEAQSD